MGSCSGHREKRVGLRDITEADVTGVGGWSAPRGKDRQAARAVPGPLTG